MKSPFYLKSLLVIILCYYNLSQLKAQFIKFDSIKNSEVESIINSLNNYNKDTTLVKKHLASKLEIAKKTNDLPILWAYNILMADVSSMFYDKSNPITDQYYREALDLIKNENYPELEFITASHQGYYNFIYRNISDAFPYFLHANYLQGQIDINKTPLLKQHYKYIANFYSYIGNHQRAIEYLKIILPFTKENSRERIDLLNSIGMYSKHSFNNHQALHFLNEAMKEAKEAKDSVWIGIMYGNLSDFSWKEGNIEQTFDYLKKNIELSLRYEEHLDAMRSSLKIATLYLSLNKIKEASRYVQDALNLMQDKPYFLSYRVDAIKCLADIAAKKGELLEEAKYLKQYIKLKEELDKQNNNEEIKKISWRFEVEKYDQTIASNKLKEKELKRTYSFVGLSIFLIAIVIILLIYSSRNKIKIENVELEKNKMKLDYDKQLLDKELVTVKNSLSEFTKTITENNLTISQLRKELANSTSIDETTKNKVSEELNNMLKSHLMTQERWYDFRHEFDLIHPNYLTDLKQNYPVLTENDLRIISLMKLNLNNKSMCDLLGISLEGVKKAKQRLKKKMQDNEI